MSKKSVEAALARGVELLNEFLPLKSWLYFPVLYAASVWAVRRVFEADAPTPHACVGLAWLSPPLSARTAGIWVVRSIAAASWPFDSGTRATYAAPIPTARAARARILTMNASGAAPLPSIDVEFPNLARWAAGNTGVPYVWTFASERAGPHVLIQALTHGNEVCGAIALDWLLSEGFRPARGTLTLCFANVVAYEAFDRADPYASRCVDEDFNRLWTTEVLDGPRRTADLSRARELRPLYEATDCLVDLHSMTDHCPPLAMAGRQRKGVILRASSHSARGHWKRHTGSWQAG